jgi:hypothetical protein
MLSTAAAAWENLQGKSCAGTMDILNLILIYTFSPSQMIKQSMDILNLILIYTFSPSQMIKQSMVISPFADICKKQGPTDHIQITY